jgi:hypothetical protein
VIRVAEAKKCTNIYIYINEDKHRDYIIESLKGYYVCKFTGEINILTAICKNLQATVGINLQL